MFLVVDTFKMEGGMKQQQSADPVFFQTAHPLRLRLSFQQQFNHPCYGFTDIIHIIPP